MGLGLHGGGVGAAKFFARAGAKITITDLRTKKQLRDPIDDLKGLSAKYVLSRHRERDFRDADLIIRNPAVPDDSPYLKIARKHDVCVDTDVGIFFELCPAPIIGVTGTRGKSTTATLIYEFLKAQHKDVILAGNIRKSVLLELPRITKETIVVLELSSWQLEGLVKHKKGPRVAVITTIMPDHLNRYRNMSDYIRAKKIIFKYQTPDDYLFLNKNDKIVNGFVREANSKVVFFDGKESKKYRTNLLGSHNLTNIAAAVKIAKHFGVSEASIKKVLKNFRGLEGRLELAAEIRGVKYINDTCATTPDATIAAIRALVNSKQLTDNNNLILIAGGADKKLDFGELSRLIVKKVKALILLDGIATEKLKKAAESRLMIRNPKKNKFLASECAILQARSMSKAVKTAYNIAEAGDIVLLSPACASFGLFRHEFERGEKFKKAIKSIK
jgi:UDP-N-acetylmuramoylalanine--D-glutamate ligase